MIIKPGQAITDETIAANKGEQNERKKEIWAARKQAKKAKVGELTT